MKPLAQLRHNPKNAVELIRRMEPIMDDAGYHCALTGSDLFKGGTDHDTDIILYPHDPNKQMPHDQLLELLVKQIGLKIRFKTTPNYVNREVWLCSYENRNIDLFFFNEQPRVD